MDLRLPELLAEDSSPGGVPLRRDTQSGSAETNPLTVQHSVPVYVGHGIRTTGLRTNTIQLQRTTTLRMCRADPDSRRPDGLLCRTVGVAVRTGKTHRYRVKIHLRDSQRSRDKRSVPFVELAPGVGQGIYSNPSSGY